MNVLFACAHIDDEAFSMGTILKLIEEGHNVHLLFFCGRQLRRKEVFDRFVLDNKLNCKTTFMNYDDFELTKEHIENPRRMHDRVEKVVKEFRPDVVFINDEDNYHNDHNTVYRLMNVVCRMERSMVKKLYAFRIPSSLNQDTNKYSTYSHFSVDDHKLKISLFHRYIEAGYLNKQYIALMRSETVLHGEQSTFGYDNMQYTERFRLIYNRSGEL